jgi:signal transduction histidine kinase
VLDDLQSVLAERKVEFTTTSLPVVTGNPTDLIQLFQNLISNAVKFVRANVTPQISIAVSIRDQEWLFQFHDNGIGIDPQNLERIFEAFHRVHSIKKYPGTGIGLATCKKIVERYGGCIWVESQVNEGTTFYFTLARAPEGSVAK